MTHTKQEIETLSTRVLEDLKRDYYTQIPLKIDFENNLEIIPSTKILQNGWIVSVSVHDDQFDNEDGCLYMYIDDDNGKVEGYVDCSMGRPVPCRAIKGSDGKYKLEIIQY